MEAAIDKFTGDEYIDLDPDAEYPYGFKQVSVLLRLLAQHSAVNTHFCDGKLYDALLLRVVVFPWQRYALFF